jgi:thymidylate synthase
MKVYQGKTFAEVYKKSLKDLIKSNTNISPRGYKVNEILNAVHIIEDPTSCLYENKRRGSQLKYIAAETLYYFLGRRDLDFIKQYASFWEQIANTDNTVNSAYGNLLFTETNKFGISQWDWAYKSLCNDKDTRQAVLLFNKPDYQYFGNKDVICTLNGVFNIRDNKLHFTVNMRSNDAILGTPTDVAFFALLQMQMCKILKENSYPELEVGTLTHIANSYHIYERHFNLASEMVEKQFKPVSIPEIGENLIDHLGKPTAALSELVDAVKRIKQHPYSTEDKLLNWIYEKTV